MFISDWIILKKLHIKESKSIVYIYTKDFWKISAWIKESKLKYPIDIWNIINVSISTKWSVNQIESYKLKKTINYSELAFKSIQDILELIVYFYNLIPEWVPSVSFYEDYLENIELLENDETNRKCTEFFKMKLIMKSWIGLDMEKSENFKKIFEFAKNNKLSRMMKINWITERLLEEISWFNKESYNLYLM